jgi:hypothetical protein
MIQSLRQCSCYSTYYNRNTTGNVGLARGCSPPCQQATFFAITCPELTSNECNAFQLKNSQNSHSRCQGRDLNLVVKIEEYLQRHRTVARILPLFVLESSFISSSLKPVPAQSYVHHSVRTPLFPVLSWQVLSAPVECTSATLTKNTMPSKPIFPTPCSIGSSINTPQTSRGFQIILFLLILHFFKTLYLKLTHSRLPFYQPQQTNFHTHTQQPSQPTTIMSNYSPSGGKGSGSGASGLGKGSGGYSFGKGNTGSGPAWVCQSTMCSCYGGTRNNGPRCHLCLQPQPASGGGSGSGSGGNCKGEAKPSPGRYY